ncbi:MAG TPA: biotin/lipoyl-containing protein, partial [Micrococcaceae bacterium]|nr:biotin/lipoyl-containing protein [Micrococcaceae bacterium]
MSESVNLPALGESVTEGTVTRWLKQVGDRVEVDEPLLEVSTDKVDTEIPSPIAGVIEEILVAEDETAEVGAPLVRIGSGEGAASAEQAPASSATAEQAPAEPAPAEQAPAEQPGTTAEVPSPDAPVEAESKAPASQPSAPAAGGDSHEVTLPALGESVTEGTVTRWLKAIGDTVEMDEPLLEVSTDKVDTEIPSPVAGTLQDIRVNEDETAEVGSVLAVIGSGAAAPAAAEAPSAPAADAAPQAPQAAAEVPAPAPAPPAPAAQPAPSTAGTEAPAPESESTAVAPSAPPAAAP